MLFWSAEVGEPEGRSGEGEGRGREAEAAAAAAASAAAAAAAAEAEAAVAAFAAAVAVAPLAAAAPDCCCVHCSVGVSSSGEGVGGKLRVSSKVPLSQESGLVRPRPSFSRAIGRLAPKQSSKEKSKLLTVHSHFRELSLVYQAQLRRILIHALVFWRKEERGSVPERERAKRVSSERTEELRAEQKRQALVRPLFFSFFFAREAPCGVLRNNCCPQLGKVRRFRGAQVDTEQNARGKRAPRATFRFAPLFFASCLSFFPSQSLGDRLRASLSLSRSLPPARAFRASARPCFQFSPCHESLAAARRGDSGAAATRPP